MLFEDFRYVSLSARVLVSFLFLVLMRVCATQDPTNAQDPVISEYVRLMQTDSCTCVSSSLCMHTDHSPPWLPCSDVRKAVVAHVGIFKPTLSPLLKRTKDIKEEVRKAVRVSLATRTLMHWHMRAHTTTRHVKGVKGHLFMRYVKGK